MPEVQIITGKVEAISPKPEKDHYGIMVNDTWFNGEPAVPSNVEKDKTVEFEFTPGRFIDLKNIKVVDEESMPKDSNAQSKKAEPSGEGSGSTTNKPKTKKQKDIDAGLCFKKAVDQTNPMLLEDSEEKYKAKLKKFYRIHTEVLDEVKQ